MVDRGNAELLVLLSLIAFIVCFIRKDYMLSSVFLAICIAFKGYPALFLVLFLTASKYKELISTILITSTLTILGFLFFKGGLYANVLGYLLQINTMPIAHSLSVDGIHFSSNIWSFVRVTAQTAIPSISLEYLYPISTKLSLIILGIITVYVLLVEKELWKSTTLLTILCMIVPAAAYDYRLILMFVPVYLFINYSTTRGLTDIFYCVCFGLLLIPKDYIIISEDISISVWINPLIMFIMVGVIMCDRKSDTKQNCLHGSPCDICKSTDVRIDTGEYSAFIAQRIWEKSPDMGVYLISCNYCGYSFFIPRLTEDELNKLYHGYRGEEYQKQRQKYEPQYTHQVNASLGASAHDPRKTNIESLLTHNNIDTTKINICLDYGGDRGDMFPNLLSHCEKYVYDLSNIPLSNGVKRMVDLNQYTFKFDYIQCCHVLEHCTNPHEIINNIIKLSHSNSIFYIEVPNDTSVNSYKVTFFIGHPVINKIFSTITV
jgi:hypothetical protein